MIAALYVQKHGAYYGLPNVDPWDEERDARLYAGPWPVVAHPPCARWSRLAGFCEARHGLKVGEDGGCFAAALRAVQTWGGVLEHPAFSKAWARFGLARPNTRFEGWQPDLSGGASCYVEQARYGHVAKKATWLYAYGVPCDELPELRWGYTPDGAGSVAKGQDWRGGMDKWRDAVGYRNASATPPEFREELIAIARRTKKRTGVEMMPSTGARSYPPPVP